MLRDTSAASTSKRSTVSAWAAALPASHASSVMMAAAVFITTHPSRFTISIGPLPIFRKGQASRPVGDIGNATAYRARPSSDRHETTGNQGDHGRNRGLDR